MNTLPANYDEVTALDIKGALLPVVYSNARDALDKCSRLDECQSWANKAEALASYAR